MTTLTAMPKYEAYKDSGVEWIGDIPTNWDLIKLGACLTPVSTKNRAGLPLLSITRELGVIERDTEDQDSNHNFIPDDLSGYKVIEAGQFGMNKMKAWQGSYGVSKYTGIVSPAYYVFKFEQDIDPDFFHWAIRSHLYISFFASASDGVRIGQWDLSKDRMKAIPFVFPEKKIQTIIANFLDEKTTKIDEAIAIKEKQIKLLKERKQIIIQQAVTRGLDPTVQMKDSGVEWIGMIPAHWKVNRIKNLGKIINGFAFPSDSFKENGVRVIKISNIQPMDIDWTEASFVDEAWLKKCRQFCVYDGDLVFALTRPIISTGIKVATVKTSEKILLNQRNAVFRPLPTCSVDWLYYIILSNGFINEFESKIDITGQQPNISTISISNLSIPIPSLDIQLSISTFLSKKCSEIDEAIFKMNEQISILKEYKTTLINSAVTGKIKVV